MICITVIYLKLRTVRQLTVYLLKAPSRYFFSTSKPPQNSNGDECVIISDSDDDDDDDQELVSQDRQQQEDQDEEDNEYESRITGNELARYYRQAYIQYKYILKCAF